MTKDLTIFYDGGCPLCVAEMHHLHRLDLQGKIAFENIYAKDFIERFPHIDQQQAYRRLHGQSADGNMLFGLDVTYQAWAHHYQLNDQPGNKPKNCTHAYTPGQKSKVHHHNRAFFAGF